MVQSLVLPEAELRQEHERELGNLINKSQFFCVFPSLARGGNSKKIPKMGNTKSNREINNIWNTFSLSQNITFIDMREDVYCVNNYETQKGRDYTI